ncbi:MAG: carboxypeptidase-like regulatory domain-containing protein [Polyangiaceae bacterium]
MMRSLVFAASAIALLACSSDAAKAFGVVPPANACTTPGIAGCTQYIGQKGATAMCSNGACSFNANPTYKLVVSLPGDGRFAPGSSFALTSTAFPACHTNKGTDPKCLQLPPLGRGIGYYGALPSAQVQVNWFLGSPQPAMGSAPSIPVHTVFRPLVPGSSTVRAIDGGLDMPSIFADPIAELPIFPLPPGPLGAAPIGFATPLPVGLYERTIQPDPPFDTAFPPLISTKQISSDQFDSVVLGAEYPFDIPSASCSASQCFTVTPPTGKILDGWSVFLRDSTTKRPISTVTRLANGGGDVRLFTVLHPDLILVDLVVAPPPALAAVPTMVISTGTVGALAKSQIYPILPGPVVYSARVVSPDGSGVPSRVFLFSDKIDVCEPDCSTAAPGNKLAFETQAVTDANGLFEVEVPPGTYQVATIPDQGTDLAISVVERQVGQGEARGGSIPVLPRASMKGTAVLTDGRPLAGAEVEARGTTQPQSATGHFASLVRVGHATTDANGFFAMPLDPGYYDVTVKPAAGTRFPWIVVPALLVQPSTVPIDLRPLDFAIPVPSDESKTILDGSPSQTPVRGALVRAYACRGQCDPSLKTVDVEIGRAYTDQDGHYEMFLAEQQQ